MIYFAETKQRVEIPLDDVLVDRTLELRDAAFEAAAGPPPPPLQVTRGAGEPLGVIASIWRDRAELDADYLSEFEGPPGSWACITGYLGREFVDKARAGKLGKLLEHVFHGGDLASRVPYPRRKVTFRHGDEMQAAPWWMERPSRV